MPPAARRPSRRAATAAVAAALLLLVAGCGDGAEDGAEPAGTTAAPTTSTEVDPEGTTTTTAAPAEDVPTLGDEVPDELATTEEGHTALVEVALGLLITGGELEGQTFVDAGYVPPEGPNPCGVDADAEHPPSVLVGTGLADAESRAIVEEIRVFDDVDAAAAAFEAHRNALGCGAAGGTTFGEPIDVNDVVGADASTEVGIVTEDESGVAITALVGDAVLTFRIAAPAATPAAIDPREVAAFGVGKVLAALEAG